MGASRTVVGVLLALGAVLAAALPAGAAVPSRAAVPSGAAAGTDDKASRLLIVALPGLTWAEVDDHPELTNLWSFLGNAAVAALAPRGVRGNSPPGDAYLTIGAGSRAVGDALSGDGRLLDPEERYAGEAAGGVFARRTGVEPGGDAGVALSWPTLLVRNDRQPYDTELGLLANTLAEDGVGTAVVANADGSDTTVASFERQAGYALTASDGTLAGGDVGRGLLATDPDRPFGVRLDADAAVEAFSAAWSRERAVVLVEASDLARVMRYRVDIDADRYEVLRAEALADADELLGRLLASVDPERDSVMVLGPYHAEDFNGLTVLGVRTPASAPGYLRSASTQRTGVVTLTDLAPTILRLVGVDRPRGMEGQEAEVVGRATGIEGRVDHLVEVDAASRFRENLLLPTTLALVMALAGIVAALIVGTAGDRSRRWRASVAFASLVCLGGFPASYLARAFPLEDLGLAFYWTFLALAALAIAAGASAAARLAGRPWVALVAVLTVVVTILVGDVLTGSNLHQSAAFGYSPTGNSRLYGISNYSFGQLSAASCILAAFVAWRWPGRRGLVVAVAGLVAVLVVLGVPAWGSDVGGIIAFTPTVLVFAALLLRVRLRFRYLVLLGLATVAAVAVFGFIDLARPAPERAHLGRLFERIGDEGIGPLVSIVQRKFVANLRVSTRSFWVAAIPVSVATWAFLRWWRTRPLARLHARIPSLHAALLAATVAAVVGSLVNDSGAIVGGVAGTVLAASLAFLVSTGIDAPAPGPARGETVPEGIEAAAAPGSETTVAVPTS